MLPDRIRCFLFDMDGTVFLGGRLLPGAAEIFPFLRSRGLPYYFLTNNSSRSAQDYADHLARLGLQVSAGQVLTSGEATARYLKSRPERRLYLVGTPALEDELRSHGFELVAEQTFRAEHGLQQAAPQAVVLGFDTTLTYAKLVRLCDLVRSGLPYIATHPDVNCPTETGFIPDIGAVIALVSASTGRQPDVIVGKPHAPMVEAVVEKTGFQPQEIAMVGDRLYTDIALGAAGLNTVLVLSGETKSSDLGGIHPGGLRPPDLVVADLAGLLSELRGDRNGV
jgi:4-nitrophenyl phosphatase